MMIERKIIFHSLFNNFTTATNGYRVSEWKSRRVAKERGGGGEKDSPLPDLNDFILPKTKNMHFLYYAFKCTLTNSSFHLFNVERGYYTTTFGLAQIMNL